MKHDELTTRKGTECPSAVSRHRGTGSVVMTRTLSSDDSERVCESSAPKRIRKCLSELEARAVTQGHLMIPKSMPNEKDLGDRGRHVCP